MPGPLRSLRLLGGLCRLGIRDVSDAAWMLFDEGLWGTVARVRLTRLRRRHSDPPVSPSSPIAWRQTMAAIHTHYALKATGPIEWSESEVRRDVMRITALTGGAESSADQQTIVVAGKPEIRQYLATIEALRSWPETRLADLVIEIPASRREPWELLVSLPGVRVVSTAPHRSDTGQVAVSAGSLPIPDFLPGRRRVGEQRPSRKRILVLASQVPDIRRGSGSLDMYWFSRHSVELGFDVLFVPLERRLGDYLGRWDLRLAGVAVTPGSVSPEAVGEALPAAVRRSDAVVVFDTEVVHDARAWIDAVGGQQKLLFVPLDLRQFPLRALLDAELAAALAEFGIRQPTELDYLKVAAEELAAIEMSDLTALISTAELEVLRDTAVGSKVTHLRMLRSEVESVALPGGNPRVVFVGGFRHAPNYLAMGWFLSEIWPNVRESVPSAQLEIYGADLNAAWLERWSQVSGVLVRGTYLQDQVPYLGDVVAVAPLPYGGGTKGKVVSAIGHGAVVVGTSFAAQGLPRDLQEVITTADAPLEFAAALVELLGDPGRREDLRRRGRAAYSRSFSPDAGQGQVSDCLRKLGLLQ